MKRTFCVMLGAVLVSSSIAQQPRNYIKRPAIAFYFLYNDFSAPAYIRSHSVNDAFKNKEIANIKNMSAGIAVGYIDGIAKHFDFSGTIAGTSLDYPARNGQLSGTSHLLLELDASVIGKLFTDRSWATPYLKGGIGVSKYQSDFGMFAPVGIGAQFIFYHDVYLFLSAEYRVPLTALANYHFYYSVGLAGNIGKKRKATINKTPAPPVQIISNDRDKDGIVDSADACPDLPGLAQYNGCPDSDGDGISDQHDRCPTVPGLARYEGCPIPDTDGDGLNDEQDNCPTVAGLARYKGCPVPDTDGDGVNDEEDRCPTVRGVKENQGCPLPAPDITQRINFAAKHIYFITGSYRLSVKSYSSLNEVIKILKENPALRLDVEGHTDNVGGNAMNQLLSENRAASIVNYLTITGGIAIDRLTSKGYGSSRPVADNNTTTGRAKNRRVVFLLKYL